jgi:hypothetical protein
MSEPEGHRHTLVGECASLSGCAHETPDRVSPSTHSTGPAVDLLRVKRILEVLRAPTDRHPRWKYQLANLRSYQVLSSNG